MSERVSILLRVPIEVREELKRRGRANYRSMQSEICAILDQALSAEQLTPGSVGRCHRCEGEIEFDQAYVRGSSLDPWQFRHLDASDCRPPSVRFRDA